MTTDVETTLAAATSETIVRLGIGGLVSSRAFRHAFTEIDAEIFAQIMYATDQMLKDFEGAEKTNPANISPTISRYRFEDKRHFVQVADIFRSHFGDTTVPL